MNNSAFMIAGYASLFDVPDLSGDCVKRGAFKRSLTPSPQSIKMLFQHDPHQPIGVWHHIQEDLKGLYVVGEIFTTIQRGQELATLIKGKALDGLSIGFKTRRARKTQTKRELLDIDLWEISLVTFPMLPQARLGQV